MMKHTWKTRAVSIILCLMLAAATAITATGCQTPETAQTPDTTETTVTTDATTTTVDPTLDPDGPVVIGEGDTHFALTVTDLDGLSAVMEIRTDKTTVGEALLEHGVIEGEDSEYGLYVTAVNGVTLDYDTDGAYWAFYIDGEYAMTGVDATTIDVNSSYELRAERA